jgi:hypothetical protein
MDKTNDQRNATPAAASAASAATVIEDLDLGCDLEITKVSRREPAPGTWVCGTLHDHRFEALVFPEHAENPEWEIGQSRISKLWVQRLADKRTVYHWDRGEDSPALTGEATAIIDFLCAGLAEHVYAM